jgi:hypothetical protein
MVAHPGTDVLITALDWAYVVAAVTVHGSRGSRYCTQASGRHRL